VCQSYLLADIFSLQDGGDYRSLKIIDFGLAKVLEGDATAVRMCGTNGFLAPEIYMLLPYRFEVDMFAFGVILFRILSGEKPFPTANEEKLRQATLALEYSFDSDTWLPVAWSGKGLIGELLCYRDVPRLDAVSALTHRWFLDTEVSVLQTVHFLSLELESAPGAFLKVRRTLLPPQLPFAISWLTAIDCPFDLPAKTHTPTVFPTNARTLSDDEVQGLDHAPSLQEVSSSWTTIILKSKQTRCLLLTLACLVVIGAAVVGVVCRSGDCKGPSESPTSVPTISPTTFKVALPTRSPITVAPTTDSITSFRNTLPAYTLEALANTTSPQFNAFEWLTRNDTYFHSDNATLQRQTFRFALATLYFATNGDSWLNRSGWLNETAHECEWYGRDLSGLLFYTSDACVDGELLSKVGLTSNNLSGTIPKEFSLLTNLTSLGFYNNTILGTIPSGLANLTALSSLDLSRNNLSGIIPFELAGLTALSSLSLSINNLSGTIPSELGGLTALSSLSLSLNNLSGTIPSELGDLTALSHLGLSANNLSGTIPSELAGLVALASLYLQNNRLTGTIPNEFVGLARLTTFILLANNVTGTIPSGLCNNAIKFSADCAEVVCNCCGC
jgi:serine/threonine protein kinase